MVVNVTQELAQMYLMCILQGEFPFALENEYEL